MINWNGKKITIGEKEITYHYEIKTVIEFDTVIIVFIAPSTEEEYQRFISEFGASLSKGPVYAYKLNGDLIWQWNTRFVNDIAKVPHKTQLLLSEDDLKELFPIYDLLVDCQGWKFYLNPETGKILKKEQTK